MNACTGEAEGGVVELDCCCCSRTSVSATGLGQVAAQYTARCTAARFNIVVEDEGKVLPTHSSADEASTRDWPLMEWVKLVAIKAEWSHR